MDDLMMEFIEASIHQVNKYFNFQIFEVCKLQREHPLIGHVHVRPPFDTSGDRLGWPWYNAFQACTQLSALHENMLERIYTYHA